jgi:hypothetical protein
MSTPEQQHEIIVADRSHDDPRERSETRPIREVNLTRLRCSPLPDACPKSIAFSPLL